jgi:hypothetical protein
MISNLKLYFYDCHAFHCELNFFAQGFILIIVSDVILVLSPPKLQITFDVIKYLALLIDAYYKSNFTFLEQPFVIQDIFTDFCKMDRKLCHPD